MVTFEGLPDGAEFDKAEGVLKWKPDFDTVNNKGGSFNREAYYHVTIRLTSSAEPARIRTAPILLKVYNTPRKMVLKTDLKNEYAKVREGEELEFFLAVESVDFPQGPFLVKGERMPPGMYIIQDPRDPAKFIVNYKPHHDTVNLAGEDRVTCSEYDNGLPVTPPLCTRYFGYIVFTITAPNGVQAKQSIHLGVQDQRLPVNFGSALELEMESPGGSFSINVFDQNREVKPLVSLASRPNFGNVSVETIDTENPYLSTTQIHWRDIPPDKNGSEEELEFKACIKGSGSRKNLCTEKKITVTITAPPSRRPVAQRNSWEKGELKTFAFEEEESFVVRFKDNDSRLVKDVAIYPESIREMVSYNSAGARMSIKALQPGLHHFRLEASGDFGEKTAEHFSFEVLDEDRSSTLYMGYSPWDPSLAYYQSMDTANYFAPILHDLDDETHLLYRDRIVISTEILQKEPQALDTSLLNREEFKRIFISSPTLVNLPEVFKKQLEEMGVAFHSRFKSLPGLMEDEDISTWDVIIVQDSGLNLPPGARVSLKGTSSEESSNPMLFGLSLLSHTCTPLMVLKKEMIEHYIAIKCPLSEGREMILSGFEWSDLHVAYEDESSEGRQMVSTMPRRWYRTLMYTGPSSRRRSRW